MPENPPPDEHSDRVRKAFDSFTERLHERLDDQARGSVEQLREAASAKDAETMRQHLEELRKRHSWLYRELANHPEIATLLDELALMGL
jgi:DNA-binding ferritin-like protein